MTFAVQFVMICHEQLAEEGFQCERSLGLVNDDRHSNQILEALEPRKRRAQPTSMNALQISVNLEYLWDVLVFQHPSESFRK